MGTQQYPREFREEAFRRTTDNEALIEELASLFSASEGTGAEQETDGHQFAQH